MACEIMRFGVGWMGGGVCEGDRRGRGGGRRSWDV